LIQLVLARALIVASQVNLQGELDLPGEPDSVETEVCPEQVVYRQEPLLL